eukprot:CAMPEP_0117448658 /NCGR_PEP_ID=MMETSP0759-20121206/7521_1 /TAXON_ID=63605 /ORGANISM="Percolomonas cosmopolitus, Strain WS" /LENGTH=1007 /DNA_ID=CAMNT_0005241065 /DNA_START=345 /DNA_END=3365 /DNA_ORIENTATION=+
MCVFLLNSCFDHGGIEEYYPEMHYFMKDFAKTSDNLHDYQIFPCKDSVIRGLQTSDMFLFFMRSDGQNILGRWHNIKPFIDFVQMDKIGDSVQMQLKHERKNLLPYNPSPSTAQLTEYFSSKHRGRIVRLTSMYSPSLHVYVCRIDFEKNLDYIPNNRSSIIDTHRALHEISPENIPQDQPLLGCVFSDTQLDAEPQLYLLTSEVFFTHISCETMGTIGFVADFLQFNFQIVEARSQIMSLCSRLQIGITHDRSDVYFTALTHVTNSSYMPQLLRSYESLEFLGDAVLSLVVAYYLLAANRFASVNVISKMHENCVSNSNLIKVANHLKIHFAVWSASLPDGNKVAADAVEAIIGAMFECLFDSSKIRKSNPRAKHQDSKHRNLASIDKSQFTSHLNQCELDLSSIVEFCLRYIIDATPEQKRAGPLTLDTIPSDFIRLEPSLEGILKEIEIVLNYPFKNRFFLIEALIFKENTNSFLSDLRFVTNGQLNNARLNFLGANVLKLVASSFVYHEDPSQSPKDLDHKTHAIIQRRSVPHKLVDILESEPFLFSPQQIVGAFSALIGAIYCDDPKLYRFPKGIDIKNCFITKLSNIHKMHPPAPSLILHKPFDVTVCSIPSDMKHKDLMASFHKHFPKIPLHSIAIHQRVALIGEALTNGIIRFQSHLHRDLVENGVEEGKFRVNGSILSLIKAPVFLHTPILAHEKCLLLKYCHGDADSLRTELQEVCGGGKSTIVLPVSERPTWYWVQCPEWTEDTLSQMNTWVIHEFQTAPSEEEFYRWRNEASALHIFGILLCFQKYQQEFCKTETLLSHFAGTEIRDLLLKFCQSGLLLCEIPLSGQEYEFMKLIHRHLDELSLKIEAHQPQYFDKLPSVYEWRFVEYAYKLLSLESLHRSHSDSDFLFKLRSSRGHSVYVEELFHQHLKCSFTQFCTFLGEIFYLEGPEKTLFDVVEQMGKFIWNDSEMHSTVTRCSSVVKLSERDDTLNALWMLAIDLFEIVAPDSSANWSLW